MTPQKNALSHLHFLICEQAKAAGHNTENWYERKSGLLVITGTDEERLKRIDRVYMAAISTDNDVLKILCSRYKRIASGSLPARAAWWPIDASELANKKE